jgi:glutathione S-transferase
VPEGWVLPISLSEDIYLVESLCDLKEDVLKTISPFMFKGETEALEKWFHDNAQSVLEQIERRLPRGARYFVANSLTMADFMIFQLIHDYFLLRNREDVVKRHAPNVFQFVHRFLDSSTILKTYIDSRLLCPV